MLCPFCNFFICWFSSKVHFNSSFKTCCEFKRNVRVSKMKWFASKWFSSGRWGGRSHPHPGTLLDLFGGGNSGMGKIAWHIQSEAKQMCVTFTFDHFICRLLGTFTVQFYDGVIRCLKRMHVKSMPEDAKGQVSESPTSFHIRSLYVPLSGIIVTFRFCACMSVSEFSVHNCTLQLSG